ncbi:hypothetical protein LCGC14_0900930 [marine sediment metagenome]|uniref:HTH cro/C1-type domain-containing protein n=1 Tax=marine sediment metagenome TaxID=412755 RepID=A0A0F9PH83_9ZZZZ
MNIGRRLALVRQSRGLTIKELAKKIGNNSYDKFETGRIVPKFDVLLTICVVLEINIWDLVAEELLIKYIEKPGKYKIEFKSLGTLSKALPIKY